MMINKKSKKTFWNKIFFSGLPFVFFKFIFKLKIGVRKIDFKEY